MIAEPLRDPLPRPGVDEPADRLPASCYIQALRLADENAIRSISFPFISTGAFGYSVGLAARIAFETISSVLPELSAVEHIRFVLFSAKDLKIYILGTELFANDRDAVATDLPRGCR